jgi:hypothetical protein
LIANIGGSNNQNLAASYESIVSGPCGELYFTSNERYLIRKLNLQTRKITVIAGDTINGRGFGGDNGLAAMAAINLPTGLSFDRSGNLFFGDDLNHRVRRIDATTGIITTVGGVGTYTLAGDSGLAVNAGIGYPVSAVIDNAGNLFVGSDINNRIRKMPGMLANVPAGKPDINLPDSNLCKGNFVTLSVLHCGDSLYRLNAAKEWRWYSGSCGGSFIGRGASITVSPTVTTTYFVRGEGDCIAPGPCASQTVYVYDPVSAAVNISMSPVVKVCRGTPITLQQVR